MVTDLVTVLDPGEHPGGSCIVASVAGRTVLVDGGHPDHLRGRTPTLLEQLQKLQGNSRPEVDLLIVTHAHMDRIGTLPELVDRGQLVVDAAIVPDPGLAWGRTSEETPPSSSPTHIDRILAALREEAVPEDPVAAAAQLADAVDLERRFRRLIGAFDRLEIPHARLGIDRPNAAGNVVETAGLRILGPLTDVQVLAADLQARTRLAARSLLNRYSSAPAAARLDALRRDLDATAASDAINQQCAVLVLGDAERSVLLSGDHQAPGPDDNPVVATSHDAMIAAAGAARPVLEIVGRASPLLPGSVTFGSARSFDVAGVGVDSLGSYSVRLDGPRTPRRRPSLSAAIERPAPAASPDGVHDRVVDGHSVEMTVRVPTGLTATVTVTVTASGDAAVVERVASDDAAVAPQRPTDVRQPTAGDLRIAELRKPAANLLWVTQPRLLASKIGDDEAAGVLASLKMIDQDVLLDLPMATTDPRATAERVAGQIRAHDGVVLLGDHDVVPSARIRCADDTRGIRDHDDWLVWSDDLYGDTTGDTTPDVPVTRVPDGGDVHFLLKVLHPASSPRPGSLAGIHNRIRTYVRRVARSFDSASEVRESSPHRQADHDPALLSGAVTYLVLHGSDRKSTLLEGEDEQDGYVAALVIDDVDSADTEVVLSGCCWGGLVLDGRATSPGRIRPRRASDSIPLRFLAAGARAFIGPTGSHYSPGKTNPDAELVGSAFHPMVLDRLAAGEGPATALHAAKLEFLRTIPERIGRRSETNTKNVELAEMKTWRQYTCLGLGWPQE